MNQNSARILKWLPLLLVFLGVIVYINTLASPFILDDSVVIVDNPDIKHVFPVVLNSRFICDFTFKLNYAVDGLTQADYHATNMAILIIGALFLFGVIRRTVLLMSLPSYLGSLIAFLSSALWIVHPLLTQSVTYICQRYESLMGMFVFMSLYCFVRSIMDERWKSRVWFDLCLLACALALGCKEVAVGLPVIILLYDYVFIDKEIYGPIKHRWKQHVSLFATWGILFFLQMNFVSLLLLKGSHRVEGLSPLIYLFTQFGVILHYIKLSFIPYPLCFDYAWQPVDSVRVALVPGLVVLFLFASTLWLLKKKTFVGFLGAFFFIILAPTSSIMPVGDIAFEQRMYLPLAAVMILFVSLVVALLQRFLRQNKVRLIGFSCLIIVPVIIAFAVLTHIRNLDYRSKLCIWRDVVQKVPLNYRARVAVVSSLMFEDQYEAAEVEAEKLLVILEKDLGANGVERAVGARNPLVYKANANYLLGRIYLRQGEFKKSIEALSIAIKIRPNFGIAYYTRALAYTFHDKTQLAMHDIDIALDLEPDTSRYIALRAYILDIQGRYSDAVAGYELAIKLDSKAYMAKSKLAWLLCSAPEKSVRNGARAYKLAHELCVSFNFRSYGALDLLAAACAELGDFDNAIKYIKQAIAVVGESEDDDESVLTLNGSTKKNKTEILSDINARLNLYKNQRPYHEELDHN